MSISEQLKAREKGSDAYESMNLLIQISALFTATQVLIADSKCEGSAFEPIQAYAEMGISKTAELEASLNALWSKAEQIGEQEAKDKKRIWEIKRQAILLLIEVGEEEALTVRSLLSEYAELDANQIPDAEPQTDETDQSAKSNEPSQA
jgi:hypothetical protein